MTLDLSKLPISSLEAIRDQLEFELKREGCRRYKPQRKQLDFHNTQARERCFMAANQIGKSYAAANELALHLTGEYPDWWQGKRFDHPIAAWAAGVTGESTRDTLQRLLLGRPGQHGTGALPADRIIDTTSSRGVADAIDTVVVRHKYGTSTCSFKSYEKGREKWQGETLHVVAFDEVDGASSAERQAAVFGDVARVLRARLRLDGKDAARRWFQTLTQATKEWNRAPWGEPAFEAGRARVRELLEEVRGDA